MQNRLYGFLLLLLFFIPGPLHAQKLKWGPEIGGNMYRTKFQHLNTPGGAVTERVTPRVSMKLGLTLDKSINRFFSIQPGLFFNSKSFNYSMRWWYRLNYLELPLNAVFRTFIDQNTSFYGAIGPYGAVGLGGIENKTYVRYGGIRYGSGNDASFKRLDAGINISTGLEFKGGLFFRLIYSAGFTDIAPDEAVREQMRGFGFSLGHFF